MFKIEYFKLVLNHHQDFEIDGGLILAENTRFFTYI